MLLSQQIILQSKYFYQNIDKFVEIGIVEKINDFTYKYEDNIIEYKNNYIYLNDKRCNIQIEIYSRSYLTDFTLCDTIIYESLLDYLDWKNSKSYPPNLFKIVEKKIDI